MINIRKLFSLCLISLCFFGCLLNDEEEIKVESAAFQEESITIAVGEYKQVIFNITPQEAIKNTTVKYRLSDESNPLISLSDISNSGLVIKGEKGGTCVLIAECEKFTSYLQITVSGTVEESVPYIFTNDVSLELIVGSTKSTSVNLSGVEMARYALTEWKSSDEDVVSVEPLANSCVFTAKRVGHARIEISHPDCEFPSYIMVYVTTENLNPVYITTKTNTIMTTVSSGTTNFSVDLVGSATNNTSLLNFEIVDGSDCIDIIYNNNICSVTPKSEGSALIKVTHPECEVSLDVRVIVVDTKLLPIISTDKPFLELTSTMDSFTCTVLNSDVVDKDYKYTFSVSDEQIIEVNQVNNTFYVIPKKDGRAIITIENELCEHPTEVYCVVNSYIEEVNNYYIFTTQNVIKTEVGQSVDLNLVLSGGTVSDSSSFSWVIEDSSIIEVITSFGTVNYGRSVEESMLPCNAVINAKKEGITTIEVTHPKTNDKCVIKVMVFPKDTFIESLPRINGSGLVKVVQGSSVEHTISIENDKIIEDLSWSIEDTNIASVNANGTVGVVEGKGKGVSNLNVSSDNTYNDYKAVVVCAETVAELEKINVLYTENRDISVFKGEISYKEISTTLPVDESLYNVSVSDNTVAKAWVSGNVLIVKGFESGVCEVVVTHPSCSNSLVYMARVEDEITIQKPYYFEYDSFCGVVIGEYKDISVNLVGATSSENKNITWECEDESIVQIDYADNECRVTALQEGQTVIYARSPLCVNAAKFIVYTAKTAEELAQRVVLNVDKKNYLASLNESIYIDVSINDEEKKDTISWSCDNIGVVSIDSNYDSAYLRCIGEGNCTVTISAEGALPINIFISVVKDKEEIAVKDVQVISIDEMLEDNNVYIEATTIGLSDDELNEIQWKIEDDKIASISGNQNKCYVKALKSGITNIILTVPSLAIERKVLLVVASSYEEILNSYYMNISKSYYLLGLNDSIDIEIDFGISKPSDDIISSIIYEVEDDNICNVIGNGKFVTVSPLNEGVTTVRVSSPKFANELSFKVCVTNEVNPITYKYRFSAEKIKGIVVGESANIEFEILDNFGNVVNDLHDLITYRLEDGKSDYFEISDVDNILVVKAKQVGDAYVYVSHPEIEGEFRVYLYSALTQNELNNMYPITTDKSYYLLKIGQKATLNLNVINDSKLNEITWSCSNSALCSFNVSSDKKSLVLTAKKSGTCTFTAKHPLSQRDVTFTVSISEFNNFNNSGNINFSTENIIFVKKGELYKTLLNSSSDLSSCIWTCSDDNIALVEGYGDYANITGLQKGLCEIVVKYSPSCYKTILCYVFEEGENINNICLINNDKRMYYLSSGDSVSIKPFSLNKNVSVGSLKFEDVLKNDVVSFTVDNGKLLVKAKNEGVAQIKVSSTESQNSYYLYFEVVEGELNDDFFVEEKLGYLSSQRSVYILDASDKLVPTLINIIPLEFEDYMYDSIVYEIADESVCSVIGSKDSCYVYANKEGETTLKVYSPYSANVLTIRLVATTDKEIIYNSPYIYVDKSSFQVKVGEYIEMECTLRNADEMYDVSLFNATPINTNICNVYVIGNIIKIVGKNAGQTIVRLSYKDLDSVNIVVNVQGVSDNLIYLTTTQNYSVISEGDFVQLNAILNGYEELDGSNFKWEILSQKSVVEGQEVVSLSGSGLSIVCNALNEGDAVIRVTHTNNEYSAVYPLDFNVKVTDRSITNPIYIKCETPVITVREGERQTINCELINGDESEYNNFGWTNKTESLFNLYGASNQAVVQGVKAGTGRITVSHPSCLTSSIDIIVIVESALTENMLLISTDEKVVEMKPTDAYKQLNVTLNGGTALQNTLFDWQILSYESTIKNSNGTSNPVIELNGSQDTAIVKPINEGVATIRVTNSATAHYIDIKIIVSTFTSLTFGQSYATLKEGEMAYITVNAPTGKTVVYESSNEKICVASGTSKKCIIEGIKTGTAIIKAYCSDGSSSDELAVTVEKNTSVVRNRIKTNLPVVTMTTSDVNGVNLSASIEGSMYANEDTIKFEITEGSNVISFVGTSSNTFTGSSVTIKPKNSGTATIKVSHSSCTNDKIVYVEVTQNAAILKVNKEFESMTKGDIATFTATLSGLSDASINDISWSVSDSSVASIVGGTTIKGATCSIKANASQGECILYCKYGSLTKSIQIVVEEIPSINFLATTSRVASGDTIKFEVVTVPENNYKDVTVTSNTSLYGATTYTYDDVNKKVIVSFTGSYVSGMTTLTASYGDLTSSIMVETSDEVYLQLLNYAVYKGGKMVGEPKYKPTSIYADVDCDYVKVYYKAFPEGANLLPSNNKTLTFYEFDTNTNNNWGKVLGNNDVSFCRIAYSKDSDGYYFTLTPIKAGYGSLHIYNNDNPNCSTNIPICFSTEFPVAIKATTNPDKSGNKTHSIVDIDNSIINLANTDYITFSLDTKNLTNKDSYKITMSFDGVTNNSPIRVDGLKLYDSQEKYGSSVSYREISEYAGTLTISVLYPQHYGKAAEVKKTFLVNYDTWK